MLILINEATASKEDQDINDHSQHSKSSAGGVASYVKSNLDHFARNDLSILEDEFETIWTEIKNTKGQNVLCCCTYRHPITDINKFNNYIDNIVQKISKENKLLFIMGDFNVNFLNYESHNDTNDFINTMISHYLLPHILHPTRVTDHSATVIDNIFPITHHMKLLVETSLVKFQITFHSLLF